MESGSDSDGPEELTAFESIKQDEEIRKAQREHAIRVAQEGKERRRQWALRRTQVKSDKQEPAEVNKTEQQQEENVIPGMLPSNIVDLLAAREKQTFSSDSEEEIINHNQKPAKKKRQRTSGPETVVLKDMQPANCLQNSLEFLKRRKMQVSRSSAVLKNSNQALRLLSSRGSLLSKS